MRLIFASSTRTQLISLVERVANSATSVSIGVSNRPAQSRTMATVANSVLPVLLDPVGHLVEQVGFEAALNGERCEQCALDSTLLLASELDLRKMPRQQVPVDDRVRACRPSEVEGIGDEFHEDFAGRRVVAHVQIGDRGRELVGIVTSGETNQEPLQRLDAILVGGRFMPTTLSISRPANSHRPTPTHSPERLAARRCAVLGRVPAALWSAIMQRPCGGLTSHSAPVLRRGRKSGCLRLPGGSEPVLDGASGSGGHLLGTPIGGRWAQR